MKSWINIHRKNHDNHFGYLPPSAIAHAIYEPYELSTNEPYYLKFTRSWSMNKPTLRYEYENLYLFLLDGILFLQKLKTDIKFLNIIQSIRIFFQMKSFI